MGAADAHREGVTGHQLADEVATLHLGNAQPRGLGALRVVLGDGGGVDHDVRAPHVFRGVADEDPYALLLQMLGLVGGGAVGAGDLVAQLLQIPRQSRHRRPADADEMGATALVVKNVRGHVDLLTLKRHYSIIIIQFRAFRKRPGEKQVKSYRAGRVLSQFQGKANKGEL